MTEPNRSPRPLEYLRIPYIAQRLKVDEQTVRLWLHEGALKGHPSGDGWLVLPEDLRDFVMHREGRRVEVYLPVEIADRLDALAFDAGVSPTEMLIRLIGGQ